MIEGGGRSAIERLARRVGQLFYRRVEFVGGDDLPPGPVLYVANHGNGLVDPMLLIGWLPPGIRFLAKSTLWDHPVVGPFVRLANAIPVYRRQDVGSDVSRNRESFAQAHAVLADGGSIGLFPEGGSFFEPGLLRLKTGAARIALGAEATHGPLDLQVVPVGFNYEARERFRSRALILVGEPVVVPANDGRSPHDRPENVRALTERIDRALREVTLNFESWEDARLLRHAADIFIQPGLEVPSRSSLGSRFSTRQAFAAALPEIERRWPEKTRAVRASVRRYEGLLELLKLDDTQVVSAYPFSSVARFVARSAALLLLWLPIATIGGLLNYLPYRIPGWIVPRLSLPVSDVATWKVFMGLFIFPLFWAVEAWIAGRWGGPWAAIGTLVAAPATGLVALRYSERAKRFVREARAYFTLLTPSHAVEELRSRRDEVRAGVEELVGLYQAVEATETRA